MSNPPSAPPPEQPAPSKPIFQVGTDGEVEAHADSPPRTPHSQSFGISNPFSPPASVASFSGFELGNGGVTTPSSPNATSNQYSFPEHEPGHNSAVPSVSTSVADLSRVSSYYGSRPNTSELLNSSRPSSARLRESFASPKVRPMTVYNSPNVSSARYQKERPKSTMLTNVEDLHKPWLKKRDPYSRIAYLLTYGFAFLGIVTGVIRCYTAWKSVPLLKGNLCLVMDEQFESPDNVFGDNGSFFREVDMSGFGNGEFEMTTASQNNSFVQNGRLYITPTLTSDNIGIDAITDGYVYNITGCTYNVTAGASYTSEGFTGQNVSAIGTDATFDAAAYYKACSAVSNATAGLVINPVQSARLSTRRSASIKFGRVEVRAKIPTGDWLWPAIWMLPVENAYGQWPLSGEIDIMEARGNAPSYPKQGRNVVRGSLNWGPLPFLNAVSKTFGWWAKRRGSYAEDFHNYVLEWSEDFIRISVDSRLHHLLDLRVKDSFFKLGDFPPVVQNGSEVIVLNNPWQNGTKIAPFDRSFYLILDVAVGGTNGWFPDGDEKPWLDGSTTPLGDFWRTRNKWLPTWPTTIEDRSMVVEYVKMWQQC